MEIEIGTEHLVDATGCDARKLADPGALKALFAAIVSELKLHPVGEAQWEKFPPPGGVTGLLMLRESHLSCHSFPEHGALALNLYCCRPREAWPWAERLARLVGAERVSVRRFERVRP